MPSDRHGCFDRDSPQAHQLVQFLSNELYKDGGTALAPWLKEYAKYPKRIDALLLATVGCQRGLLTFIEFFPDIFILSRDKDPHMVSLKTLEFCDAAILGETATRTTDIAAKANKKEEEEEEEMTARTTTLVKSVQEKALYVLRRRKSRISRRKVTKVLHDDDNNDDDATDGNNHQASVAWLLYQCAKEMHHYLRAVQFYPVVYQAKESIRKCMTPTFCRVGGKEWSDLVLASFRNLMLELPSVQLDDTRVALSTIAPDNSVVSDRNTNTIGIALRDAVTMDGATQVCLSLLISRYDNVKKILGGRDIMELVETDPEAFRGLDLRKNDVGDVLLRLTEESGGETNGGRMQVDEVGLFSVTSGRWGTAIANTMSQEAEKFLHRHSRDINAIDLTASIGGLTLALSKRFNKIVAIEIDEQRAALCVQNMRRHGRENVEVRNVDAMAALDDFDNIRSVAVFIDPPWGGHEYKRLKKAVTMGQWSLDEVIVKCCRNLAPVVIGQGIVFELLKRRTLGPQLLLVLAAR
jgi:16S rRNA G966 N2-methylase RsmD